jgi:L-rhamnose-H+ transport protein
MSLALPLILIIFAGIINGSYAAPMKRMKGWVYENIWFQWAFWTFLIIPWIFISTVVPSPWAVYASAPTRYIIIMAAGGTAFGIGQICFAFALHSIGLGLAFVLNIGIATGLGFLLPLFFQYPERIATPFGLITISGTLCAIVGIILCTGAGNLRDKETKGRGTEKIVSHAHKGYRAGVILASIAGFASACQNFSFSESAGLQKIAQMHGATVLGASNIFWPGFLSFCAIPYILYMAYLLRKNRTLKNYRTPGTKKYFLYGIVMGLFWYGSLIFYSKASQLIGELGPVVGWPLFMIFIILTTNFWGYITKEWEGTSRKTGRVMISGIACLVIAVVILAIGNTFQ